MQKSKKFNSKESRNLSKKEIETITGGLSTAAIVEGP